MEKKCSKYEGLFIFSDEETLKKHIEECEECRSEHEKMEKVSDLIGEVKNHYITKMRKRNRLRVACAISLVLFSTLSLGIVATNDDLVDSLRYGDTLSAEELGFPVDAYGLLMVDDEF